MSKKLKNNNGSAKTLPWVILKDDADRLKDQMDGIEELIEDFQSDVYHGCTHSQISALVVNIERKALSIVDCIRSTSEKLEMLKKHQ